MDIILKRLFARTVHQARSLRRANYTSHRIEVMENRVVCSATSAAAQTHPLELLDYHSLPDAPVSLYLDFLGDDTPSWSGFSPGVTPAFDTDGDPTTFSDNELLLIDRIWARVSEMFSPFNIDVTTTDPGPDRAEQTMRVVVGGDGAWEGTASGVSEVDSFSDPNRVNLAFAFLKGSVTPDTPTTNSLLPAAVAASDPTAITNAQTIADTIAHEAGHAFGLRHQRVFNPDGSLESEYNGGDPFRAPIMGTAALSQRALWWVGPSDSADSIQDDITVLARDANGFGYRPDEAGDTMETATALIPNPTGSRFAGTITTVNDVDMYSAIQQSAGHASIQVSLPAYGAMLDAAFDVLDAQGHLIASIDTPSLGETATVAVPAGKFYVAVRSHGSAGDIGSYAITVHTDVQLPVIAKLSQPKIATLDENVTLSFKGAVDYDGTVQSVTFYRDTNGDGVFNPSVDALLGDVTQFDKHGNASLTIPAAAFASGNNTVFAIPRDNSDADGVALTTVVRIQTPLQLTATPKVITAGDPVTLDASDVSIFGTTVKSVSFYLDVNDNGLIDRHDKLIGVDKNGTDGWSMNVDTTNLTGSPQFIAVAKGANRRQQAPGTAILTINSPPQIGSLEVFHEPQLPQSIFSVQANGLTHSASPISLINFYIDSNGNGQLDSDDDLIGTAHDVTGTSAKIRFAPTQPAGAYLVFAVAQDTSGAQSTPAVGTLQIM
jgi:hypothetical protein